MQMKIHRISFALLAAVSIAAIAPPSHADHVGGPPYEAGILCFDGANRGGVVRMQVRSHVDKGVKGRTFYKYPFLGYYTQTVCKRLSDIGVRVGQVVEIWHEPVTAWKPPKRCTDRYTVRNIGGVDGKHFDHIFVQVGGSTIWDSNCRFKTREKLPNHARHLIHRSFPEQQADQFSDKLVIGAYPRPPIKAGTVCFDGANRGTNDIIGQLRSVLGRVSGGVVYATERMGYYTPTECANLDQIDIKRGTKLAAFVKMGDNLIDYTTDPIKICRGRNVIINDGSAKRVWIQMRGGTVWDYYCETKWELNQPPLK